MAKKHRTNINLTLAADRWLMEQSEKRGISKNSVIQELINKAMEESHANKAEKEGG